LGPPIYAPASPIALLFNRARGEIAVALHLSAELKLFSSPFYVALTLALALLVGANIMVLTRRRDILRRGNPAVMMGFAIAFLVADFVSNTSPHYQFGTLYSAGKPMESAGAEGGGPQAGPTAPGPQPA